MSVICSIENNDGVIVAVIANTNTGKVDHVITNTEITGLPLTITISPPGQGLEHVVNVPANQRASDKIPTERQIQAIVNPAANTPGARNRWKIPPGTVIRVS